MEEPVVFLPVVLYEIDAVCEVHRNGLVLFVLHIGAVDVFLPSAGILSAVQGVGKLPFDMAFPRVSLLTASHLEGVVLVQVVGTAFLPVVPVVGHHVGVDAVSPEDSGHRVVIVLKRAPGTVQEIVSSGVKLPSCRHAGKGSGIELVECDGVPAESLEVGSLGPITAVRLEEMAVQRIERHHDSFHR